MVRIKILVAVRTIDAPEGKSQKYEIMRPRVKAIKENITDHKT